MDTAVKITELDFKQVVVCQRSLLWLAKQKLPAAFSLKVAVFVKQVSEFMDLNVKTRENIITSYSPKVDDKTSSYVFKSPEEEKEVFNKIKELEDSMRLTTEFTIPSLIFESIKETEPENLIGLLPLID